MNQNVGLRALKNARLKKQQKKLQPAGGVLERALGLHQCCLIAEAQALYREILREDPRHFDALHLLGVSEYQVGRYDDADELLLQAINVNPQSPEVHSNRGNVLIALKRFDDALQSLDKAIAIKPDYADALSNRGNLLTELGRPDEALASYDRALAIKPHFADALSNRGNVLTERRRFGEAVASCDKAIAVKPDHAEAFINRGNALMELKRLDNALASYDRAIAINPKMAGAWLGRGNALLNGNHFDDAYAAYKRALALKPDYYKAHTQIAWCYLHRGDIDEVMSCYDKALAIKPDYPQAISNRIFALDLAPHAEFEEQQDARRYWWEQVGEKIAATSEHVHGNSLDPERRLVLGYISSDFREHSAAKTFGPILKRHDKTQFEIVCYSCATVNDKVTAEFQRIADKWRDVSQLSDGEIAAQVRADSIDILVDLAGHSAGHRLGVFARKPAPVQVTAWGHAHGTGLQTIDYLFSDSVAIPNRVRDLFAEKIFDLPCLVTVESESYNISPSPLPYTANGFVTFGIFNRINKISDDAVMAWSQILQSVPRSRILLKDFALDDPAVREMLREKFARHGISADRLDFLGATPRADHLLAFSKVDIALDPFPQNGGVSTWDALYDGVPVVAKLGESVPSRVAGAILSSLGLHEWVAGNVDDYVAIAVKHASDPDALGPLRQELPARIAASPTGDNAAYTRAVESAYRTMWMAYCEQNTQPTLAPGA